MQAPRICANYLAWTGENPRSRNIFGKPNYPARLPARLAALFLLACAASPPGTALAATAEELFADGNRLFRDDLYWAALLRYREAQDAGMDTPLLHYNAGVAHYKAGQHLRAREALVSASRSPTLEVHAHYNLGLNALAMGDDEQALAWFRLARDQARFPEISALAETAIARIQRQQAEEQRPVMQRAEAARPEPKPLGAFTFNFAAGFGSDDNAYRTPADSYVDLADPNLAVVTPVVQSGTYVPLRLAAQYTVNSFENESFFGAYRYVGRLYQDELLKNADEHVHELSFGSEYRKLAEETERVIYSAFTIAQRDGTYYDRDDGGTVVVDDADIGARMNYMRYGPEIWFRQSFERFSFGGRGKGQLWNYENTGTVPEYDHEYVSLGLNAQYRFTRTSLLRVTADTYQRHFGTRPSYELDGTQPIGNEPVRYDYLDLGVSARQRVTRGFWFGLNYIRTDRRDRHVGYNDYIRNSFGAELHLDLGWRFDLDAAAIYEVYDYANAFAFHNPVAGRKTMERSIGTVAATLRLNQNFSLVGAYLYNDVASNDARLAYNRSQFELNLRWEQ
ncbi:MAG TPA: hypothetical protein VLB07_07530 [Woeseiaceae bacterium]|nr:hypothetical protein [Woeseiaceae bacterium]